MPTPLGDRRPEEPPRGREDDLDDHAVRVHGPEAFRVPTLPEDHAPPVPPAALYTREGFVEVVANALPAEEGVPPDLAAYIGARLAERLESADVREAVRLARLAHPKEEADSWGMPGIGEHRQGMSAGSNLSYPRWDGSDRAYSC